MAFCSHCGEPAHNDAAFCTTCGKPIHVYRPSTGTFFFRYDNSAGPADETLEFGVLDGYPIAGAFGLERSN